MLLLCIFFFFNDTATTEIYTLSLHDALPISHGEQRGADQLRHPLTFGACLVGIGATDVMVGGAVHTSDRKSTRLNSSHSQISYAVFCLKKKKKSHQFFPT